MEIKILGTGRAKCQQLEKINREALKELKRRLLMEEKKPTLEQVLKKMEDTLGEKPSPMMLMSNIAPEIVFRHAQDRKFVFDLPDIPSKYKHLIMIAVAAAVSSHSCTTSYIKIARRSGVSKEEIAEAIITARFTLGSTVVSTATEGLEHLVKEN